MKKYFIILFVLYSCARIGLTDKHPVYLGEVDKIIEITQETLIEQGLYTQEQINHAMIYHMPKIYGDDNVSFKCKSSIMCYGEFSSEFGFLTIRYGYQYKERNLVLAHEFLHFFEWIVFSTQDTAHKQEKIFEFGCRWKYPSSDVNRQRCAEESVEGIIRAKLKSINKL